MLSGSESVDPSRSEPRGELDFRLVAGALLLAVAIVFTWLTIDGFSSRRRLRLELAEISHVRYDLLDADRWVKRLAPILEAKIDALDLTAPKEASLRPAVEGALYRLLNDVGKGMAETGPRSAGGGGLLGQGNALMANLMVGMLRPHVPEYADRVLAELGKPETRGAIKKYVKSTLAEGAMTTFGNVDRRWYSYILKEHGCADSAACQQQLGNQVREADARLARYYLTVLAASAAAFLLLMTGRRVLPRSGVVVLMLFCIVLLAGGVVTPMIEVEAKISRLDFTFLGEPIAFSDQSLYFQSKSVLEVFHTLITAGRADMWVVGVLVLTFSVVFPTLKTAALAFGLCSPVLLKRNRLARFLALNSSKWSMADVMALAIFMSFVAFDGLVSNTMGLLAETGAKVTIPTDSSKLLPGCILFLGYCVASVLLSKKLEQGLRTAQDGGTD